ncbi:RuvB-like helicase 1 [Striga asiatica]|uniref:RuvB-like helicase 1 n=1 Tax=Striga asiatica TaxID=4170 RepID=A0A5A7QCG6_STRAF|nr:RuvB-like helicase 1 [Striga asiatica]
MTKTHTTSCRSLALSSSSCVTNVSNSTRHRIHSRLPLPPSATTASATRRRYPVPKLHWSKLNRWDTSSGAHHRRLHHKPTSWQRRHRRHLRNPNVLLIHRPRLSQKILQSHGRTVAPSPGGGAAAHHIPPDLCDRLLPDTIPQSAAVAVEREGLRIGADVSEYVVEVHGAETPGRIGVDIRPGRFDSGSLEERLNIWLSICSSELRSKENQFLNDLVATRIRVAGVMVHKEQVHASLNSRCRKLKLARPQTAIRVANGKGQKRAWVGGCELAGSRNAVHAANSSSPGCESQVRP